MYNAASTARARQGSRWLGLFASLLLPGAALLPVSAEESAKKPSLEETLQAKAPEIRKFLWEKMAHPEDSLHVGVLKFQVQVGEEPAGDNAGSLNLYMARRLEAALILCLQENDKVRILHNPSAQVARSKSVADHRSAEGRKRFFSGRRYQPAWGNEGEKIPAHSFVTGLVKIRDAGRTAEILVTAFDQSGKEPIAVCRFKTAADPRMLTEAGISFVLSRGGKIEDWQVALANQKGGGADDKKPTPAELLRQAPIGLQILYNGEEQKVANDGTVAEPTPTDTITFRLSHKNKDEKTYGVILKVNGQNTLLPDDPESDDFFRCYKWVVKPGSKFEIQGFQKDLKEKAKGFKVLSATESRQKKMYYGEHAGTFTVIILESRRDDEKPQIVQARPADVLAIGRGVPDGLKSFGSLKALQNHLQEKQRTRTKREVPKGLIESDDKDKEQMVEEIPFHASAKRIPVIQIRYYKPSSGE